MGAQAEPQFFRPFVCLAQCLALVRIQQMVDMSVMII